MIINYRAISPVRITVHGKGMEEPLCLSTVYLFVGFLEPWKAPLLSQNGDKQGARKMVDGLQCHLRPREPWREAWLGK